MSNLSNPIRIYEADLTLVGEMDEYSSAYLTRSWYGVGKFSIQTNANTVHAGDLQKGRLVMFAKDKYRCGIITSLEKSVDENGKGSQIITATGFELTYIFSWRIVLPPAGQAYYTITNSAETVMKTLINDQCGTAADPDRKYSALTVNTDMDRGSTYVMSSRLNTTVADELQKVSLATEVGYFIYLDEATKKYVFDVGVGVDRTADQSVNPRAIFYDKYDTIKAAKYLDSDNQYRNYAYTAGQGIGENRTIREVFSTTTEPTDLDRREMYVDARDLTSNADLDARGGQKLGEVQIQFTVDGVPLTCSPLLYRIDYDLGDLVTIDVYNSPYNARVTEVKESWSPLKYNIDVVFDKEPATLPMQTNRAIESLRAGLNATEGKFQEVQAIDRVITPRVDNNGGGLGVGVDANSAIGLQVNQTGKLYGIRNYVDGGSTTTLSSGVGVGYVGTLDSSPLVLLTGEIERVRVMPDGNVLIGTGTDVAGKQQIVQTAAGPVQRLENTNGDAYQRFKAKNFTGSFDVGALSTEDAWGIADAGGAYRVTISRAGYTKLGADAGAPAVKMKKLTGTTASTQGGAVDVAHGVSAAKIISATLKIEYSGTGTFLPPAVYSPFTAQFYIASGTNNFTVENVTGASASILSKPFTITLWYEE